jgi:hypothetical protein
VTIRFIGVVCAVCFAVLLFVGRCYSASVVFVAADGQGSDGRHELELASRFYGLDLNSITLGSADDEQVLRRVVEGDNTVAVAIAANALPLVDEKKLLQALNRRHGGNIPLFILGVTPETDTRLLGAWSGRAAIGSRHTVALHDARYVIGHFEGVTKELSDIDVPFPASEAGYFLLDGNSRAQQIMAVRAGGRVLPVFIETVVDQVKVFLSSTIVSSEKAADEWTVENMVRAFVKISPAMMFIKYSAGERGWHTDQHYANLTIDDPWLREPYGHFSYLGLLQEMERHNFHSTIAFIPWNYDRSQPETVSTFREHPDRFSISIHGDNHDHKEFTDYRSKALSVQIPALKQAVARMDRFQALTGIPYDKVMVFPHSIAPEKTLEALKTYNFLATVNSSNVPMDRTNPSALPFALRPITMEFANFASIRRYSVEGQIPDSFIAVNEFLDNPLFFYCHQDFFSGGIDAFDGIADQVNRLEPNTRWLSLGEIVRHLYLVKLRDDTDYDVLAFSSEVRVGNVSGRDAIFHVRKQEDGQAALGSVSVDGQDRPYRLDNGYLDLAIPIPAGQARSVVIRYQNDLNPAAIDISKQSARVYLLRTASDFRDLTLTRYAAGRALIGLYYEDPVRRARIVVCLAALIPLLVFCLWVGLRLRKTTGGTARMRNAGTPT